MIRRLAAILALDVVGYSRMMGLDEEWTLATLKRFRRNDIDPAIAKTNGRIFKTTGDGLLAEFQSVFDAFACALEIQTAIAAKGAPEDGRPDFSTRIGINIGDIMDDGDDIFGEGVNIAARIEPLAAPGGICISGRAWEDLCRLPVHFTNVGEVVLKNIANPVPVYAYAGPKSAAAWNIKPKSLAAAAPAARPAPVRRKWLMLGGGVAACATIVAFATGMFGRLSGAILPTMDERTSVEQVVADTPCSWLELSGYSHDTAGSQIGVRGAQRAPDILEDMLRRALTGKGYRVGRIDVSDVAPISPRQCPWIEAIRSYRHIGLPFFKASVEKRGKDIATRGVASAFASDRLDRFVIQFDQRSLPTDLAIFIIDSAGAIHFVANKAQFIAISRSLDTANLKESDFPVDQSGWFGLLIAHGSSAIDPAIVSKANSDGGTFANHANGGQWQFELIWLRADQGTATERPA